MSAENYLSLLSKLKFQDPSSLEKKQEKESVILSTYTKDFGRTHPSYTIKVRLLPNFKIGDDAAISPYRRVFHQFESDTNPGKWITVGCPGRDCIICNTTHKIWPKADTLMQERIKKYFQKDFPYINCYVISNPVDPSQNGKIKLLKMNNTVRDIFDNATTGRYSRQFGKKVFVLDKNGCTFNINITIRSGFPQFGDSYFADQIDSEADVANLTDEDISRIYGETINIPEMFKADSAEKVKEVFAAHIRIPGYNDDDSVDPVSDADREPDPPSNAVVIPVDDPVAEKSPSQMPPKNRRATTDSQIDDMLSDINMDL